MGRWCRLQSPLCTVFPCRVTARWRPSSGTVRPAPRRTHAAGSADADPCAVCGEPVLLSASTHEHFQPPPSLQHLLDDSLPPLSRPCGAQHAVRSSHCAAGSSHRAHSRLGRPLLPVRRTRGRGGRGEGGTIIAFSGSILVDARLPLSAPCRAQHAVRPGHCAEKLLVLFVACLIVWLIALCG